MRPKEKTVLSYIGYSSGNTEKHPQMVPFASLTCNSFLFVIRDVNVCLICSLSLSLNYLNCTDGVGAVMSVGVKINIAMKRAARLLNAYFLLSHAWK